MSVRWAVKTRLHHHQRRRRCFSSAALENISLQNLDKFLDEQPQIYVTPSTYGILIRKCSSARALEQGTKLHHHILRNGQIQDRLLANLLIFFYGKCGEIEEAYNVFQGICYPNLISWTILITAFAQNGRSLEAVKFFCCMGLEGIKADIFTLAAVLEACANHKALEQGRLIHQAISSEGIEADPDCLLENNLLNMYGRCGSLDEARDVFERMQNRKNLITWNMMISALSQNDRGAEAVVLWKRMHLEGFKPDKVSFVTFVDACTDLAAADEGESVHRQIVSLGLESNRIICNTLVNMYSKCRNLETARAIFERISDKDTVSWNSMISGYVLHALPAEAFQLFREMDVEGVQPTKVTFVTTLDACCSKQQVQQLRSSLAETNVGIDEVVAKALMNAYRRCQSPEDVEKIFSEAVSMICNVSLMLWNALLAAFAERKCYGHALVIFRRMQLEGVKADKVTLISAMEACSFDAGCSFREGKMIHSCVVELGFHENMFVQTAMINMYSKFGELQEATNLFQSMKVRDSIAWNAMLSSFTQQGFPQQAVRLFLEMDLEGESVDSITLSRVLDACQGENLALAKAIQAEAASSQEGGGGGVDLALGNALLNAYGKGHLLQEAEDLFQSMKLCRSDVSFNTMMAIQTQHGGDLKCLSTFRRMQLEGFKPSNISYVTALEACTNLAALSSGRAIHESLRASGIRVDVITETAVVNMYGKCGSLEMAWSEFEAMRNERDFVCWNTVIAAFAQYGHGERTVSLLRRMQQEGARPDEVSFLVTMAACAHCGLLNEAVELFVCMRREHCLVAGAAHFGCVIDVLGRSGMLREAEEFIRKLPPDVDLAAWKIFLNSCKEQGDAERGRRAGEIAIKFQPKDNMPYLLLANMFAQDDTSSLKQL